MDCRETQTLLNAFHDGELPAADRARVEEHLRGCRECGALLADLARADLAAGVPDPGPAYWDRFNARVMDRVEREADGPRVAVLRPKHGWMRQQLRYLVPAAAAAALVVGVVRYGGMPPGAPTPAVPPAVSERAAQDSAGERMAKADPESDGQGWPSAGAGRDATDSVAPARATKKAESTSVARRVPPPDPSDERSAAATREERDRLADRSLPAGNEEASRDRAAVPAAISVPSPPVTAGNGIPSRVQGERKKMAGTDDLGAERQVTGKAESASGMKIAKESSTGSPCELARALAERERIRDAEDAQRACLAGDLDAPSREKSLVFLAELLDRQARFAEADAVIAEVDRKFPQSRPLDLYRQQRPVVQKQPKTVPVTR
jgi:anti-sigma factor RsiW